MPARRKGAKRITTTSAKPSDSEKSARSAGEEPIATFKSAAGVILAVTENRNWIEVFFDGVLMHTETVNLPSGKLFDIYIEEIPHKTTVYEHPRTMIFFDGPSDLAVVRDGDRVIVSGVVPQRNQF